MGLNLIRVSGWFVQIVSRSHDNLNYLINIFLLLNNAKLRFAVLRGTYPSTARLVDQSSRYHHFISITNFTGHSSEGGTHVTIEPSKMA